MKKSLLLSFSLIALLLTGCNTSNRKNDSTKRFLNLDFSVITPGTRNIESWFMGEIGYTIRRESGDDSTVYRIVIHSSQPNKDGFGMLLNHIPIEQIRGKTILFKGRVKTENVIDGYAGLWCGINSPYGPMDFTGWDKQGINGTTDWQETSVEMKIEDEAQGFNFGAILNGKGSAKFDKFEIYIDGEKYIDEKEMYKELSTSELSWLKSNIHPLKTVDPNASSDTDLEILDKLIGNSKVVALGETTHGSSEIYKMKHRIIKYLAQKRGYDVFSIEANMPEAYLINNYVISGVGNSHSLIKNMKFWTWNTQEMLDLVECMKQYNNSEKKIQYTGFDMQYYMGGLDNIENAFRNDHNTKNIVITLRTKLKILMEKIQKGEILEFSPDMIKDELKAINELKTIIKQSNKSAEEKDWLLQNTAIVEQSLDMSNEGRDRSMAENFMWIKSHNPKSKFIIWAHNGHITKEGETMGKHLADKLGDDYLNIGFTFYEGSYTAMGDKGLTAYNAETAHLGTYEYYFEKADCPIFIIDLRKVRQDRKRDAEWLKSKLKFRGVGALKTTPEFFEANIKYEYDLLIYIKKSTPSTLLKN